MEKEGVEDEVPQKKACVVSRHPQHIGQIRLGSITDEFVVTNPNVKLETLQDASKWCSCVELQWILM